MIQVNLVDYSRLTDLGMQITKYVNRNLKDIIRECDLRERYLEVRHMSENRNHTSLSQNIIMELCSVIRRFQKRIPHFEKRGEVQITADLHDSVEGILNSRYGLSVAREFTMGRAIKKLGETDLYIYKESVRSRKQVGSFCDNIRVSVIVCRVSVFVYGQSGKN